MTREAQAKPCPICRRPSQERFRPFCSSRCAQRDLGHWLNDSYAIPATAADEEEGEDLPKPDDSPRGG